MATFNIKPGYAFEALLDTGTEEPLTFPCTNAQNAVDSSVNSYAEATAVNIGEDVSGIVFSYSPEQLIEMGKWQPTGVQISLDCEVSFNYGDGGYAILLPCARDSETGVCSLTTVETQMIATFPEAAALEEGESVTVSKRGQSILTAQINNEIIQAAFQGYTSMIVVFAAASAKIYDASITVTGNKKISKVIFGNDTVIDLTSDTVAADKLLLGYTAHDASGAVITGTAEPGDDTSDADALASDIQSGKTAYVNGIKLTGTNTNNCDTTGDSVTSNMMILGVTAHDGNGNAVIGSIQVGASSMREITTKDQVVAISPAYYSSPVPVSISSAEQAKIIPSNIRQGVTILGIPGSYYGGGNVANGINFLTVDGSGYPLTVELLGSLSPYECSNSSASVGAFSKMTAVTLPSGITDIPQYLFRYCAKLASITGLSSVTTIGTYAFHSCADLVLTSLPANLTTVGSYAFVSCKKLNPSTIKVSSKIDSNAFQNCTGMSNLTVIQSPTIASSAFNGCTGTGPKLKIKAVQIGNSTASNNAFKGCTALRAVWIDASAIFAGTANYAPFNGCSNLIIYTPYTEKQSGWGNFFNYLSSTSQAQVVYGTSEAQFDALSV